MNVSLVSILLLFNVKINSKFQDSSRPFNELNRFYFILKFVNLLICKFLFRKMTEPASESVVDEGRFRSIVSCKWLVIIGFLGMLLSLIVGIILGVMAVHCNSLNFNNFLTIFLTIF